MLHPERRRLAYTYRACRGGPRKRPADQSQSFSRDSSGTADLRGDRCSLSREASVRSSRFEREKRAWAERYAEECRRRCGMPVAAHDEALLRCRFARARCNSSPFCPERMRRRRQPGRCSRAGRRKRAPAYPYAQQVFQYFCVVRLRQPSPRLLPFVEAVA